MKAAFYSGVSGLMAYQEALNTIGNNVANVNTVGYKAQTTSFQDLLYTDMYVNTETNPLTGHGVKAVAVGITPGQAALIKTDRELDFAINGDGWFAVERDGRVQYTRNGSFSIGLEGYGAYLVTSDGAYVLDSNGYRIYCDSSNVKQDFAPEVLCERIGVFTFANPEALEPVSSTCYVPTAISGAAAATWEGRGKIISGFLENSGVELTEELSRMIAAQRAYQISARLIQVADENEQTINGLGK